MMILSERPSLVKASGTGGMQELFDRDEIYRAEYDGWYDVSSERLLQRKNSMLW